MKHTARIGFAAAGAAALLALSACSSGTTPTTAPTGADGSAAPVAITVGVPPSIFAVPYQVGIDQGIFEKHGIDITLQKINSAADGLALVQQGTLQFTHAEVPASLTAAIDGAPYRIVAPLATDAPKPPADNVGFGDMLVAANSSISSPKDLEGKTVGTNTIGGVAYYQYLIAFENAGVDASKINFTQIPGPQQLQALKSGQVDAIESAEPNATKAVDAGDAKVLFSADGTLPNGALFGVQTSLQYIQQHGDVVKRFQEAILEANQVAASDRAAAEAAAVKYLGVTAEVAAQLHFPTFATAMFTEANLTPIQDLLIQYGDLKKAPPVDDVLWQD